MLLIDPGAWTSQHPARDVTCRSVFRLSLEVSRSISSLMPVFGAEAQCRISDWTLYRHNFTIGLWVVQKEASESMSKTTT